MSHIPSEFTVGGIYLPPSLVAGCLGVLLAYWTSRALNRNGCPGISFIRPWFS